jgi:biopolymer transport protein ExbB
MKNVTKSWILTLAVVFGIAVSSFAKTPASKESADKKEAAVENASANASENASANNVADAAKAGKEDKKAEAAEPQLDFVQTLKQKYIEGDPLWMTPVLICMIIGIALSIERIIYLNLSTINTEKFLNRSEEGIDMVEKSVVSYGGVQMGLMEKGLSWLQLFIALSPMLGFLGTVIGMIQAFDKIVKDGQVSPTTVADGIKVALLTTVFGLISAMFLQVFYNYITAKIDDLVNEMENASISLIDILLKNKAIK